MTSSPFSWNLEPIKLPRSIINYFCPKGIYVPGISYANLVKIIPDLANKRRFLSDSSIILPELELKSQDPKKEKEANQESKKAIKQFTNGRISNIERAIIFKTSSEPIKLRFYMNGKYSKDVVYVKKPDTNRIIGKTLYNIISGLDEFRFKFNETAFLEEGIRGNPLSSPRINEQRYLQSEEYREGLVRAAVHAEFLDLLSDVVYPANRLINTNMRTVLFDFNYMFVENMNEKQEVIKDVLLQNYFKRKSFFTSKLHDIYLDEQRNISDRIKTIEDEFIKMTHIFGELPAPNDPYGKNIDQKIQNNYGKPNLTKYLLEKVEEYSRV